MIARITKIVFATLAIFCIFGIGAYFALTMLVKSESTVAVPDLVGKDTVEVLEMLSRLDLNTKVTRKDFSDTVPTNHVIFQDPAAGTEIKTGRDVQIVISKGPVSEPTPNLVGLTEQQARLILEEKGLCRGLISTTYDSAAAKDFVIAQFPSPGFPIAKKNYCIDLLVSEGKRQRTFKMPDLRDLDIDEAIELIEKSKLVLGKIKSFYREDKAKNMVIDQEPSSGNPVIAGGIAHVVINRDPDRENLSTLHAGGFIRHRVDTGFLKKRIRARFTGYGISEDLIDRFVPPGEEVWILVPTSGEESITVQVYEDGELVVTRKFD